MVVKSGTSQGNVYLSDDRGVTWKEIYDPGVILTDPPSWTHVTSNSDGRTIAVMEGNGQPFHSPIHVTSDAGATWTISIADMGAPYQWFTIASSPDGTLVASAVGGTLWIYR